MVAVSRAHFLTPAGPPFELRLAHQTLHPFVVAPLPLAAQFLGDPWTAVPAAFGLEHLLDLLGQFPVVRLPARLRTAPPGVVTTARDSQQLAQSPSPEKLDTVRWV